MSLDLESLRIFIKVADLGSFTQAARQLKTTKSRVSLHVQDLEGQLGSKLLQRTTRLVRITPDGEQLLARARRLIVEADELESMFEAPSTLRGQLRIDLPLVIARDLVIPRLPDFLALHPQLEVQISSTDRRVEVVREGFDCVLSVGALAASNLVARRLGMLGMVNCASPGYLRKYGVPRDLADLARHFVVHYSPTLGADAPSFEYREGHRYLQLPMRCLVTVNNSDAYTAACLSGLGIIQSPRWGTSPKIASGLLEEVLPDYPCEPMPVSLVHSHGRSVPKRVRAVMNWMAQLLQPHLV